VKTSDSTNITFSLAEISAPLKVQAATKEPYLARFENLSEWQTRMKAEAGVQVGTNVWRKCFRKRSHASKGKAEAAGRSLLKRYGIKQGVYHCIRCGGWHTKTLTN
jgi:hypothetical protein